MCILLCTLGFVLGYQVIGEKVVLKWRVRNDVDALLSHFWQSLSLRDGRRLRILKILYSLPPLFLLSLCAEDWPLEQDVSMVVVHNSVF